MRTAWTVLTAMIAGALVGLWGGDGMGQEDPGEYWTESPPFLNGSLHGAYRMRLAALSDFELDDEGSVAAGGKRLYHRLRLNPRLSFGRRVSLISEVDVFNGNLVADRPSGVQASLTEFGNSTDGLGSPVLRECYVQWDSPAGVFKVGQQTSHWGLGILANSGKEDSFFAETVGGDLVERFLFITRPLALFSDSGFAQRLHLALGADAVFRDENADWMAGDRAYQGVGSLFYLNGGFFAGFYTAWRTQEDSQTKVVSYERGSNVSVDLAFPPDTLDVLALDLFLRYKLEFNGGRLSVGGEGVFVTGSTTRGTSPASPEELDVRQWGGAVNAEVMLTDPGIAVLTLAGYASGDSNPSGDSATAFRFDPAWRAGMILFEDVLAGLTANSARRLAGDRPIPPSGIRSVPTGGGVTNAFFVAPGLAFIPLEGLEIRGVVLWALAPEGISDPYLTSLVNGGYPVNHWNVPSRSKNLGWELDGGVQWAAIDDDSFQVVLSAAAGTFLPGQAFDAGDSRGLERVSEARAVVEVKW